MQHPSTTDNASPAPGKPADLKRVGTLRYTTAGLVWVFIWLLWGDFVFTLMEAAAPTIIPLRLKELGISDWLLPIVVTTLPSLLNTTLNPIISTASDRHRGSWGRRIPFLIFSAPFICGALVLLAFSPEIGDVLARWIGPLTGWSAGAVAVLTLSVLWIVFIVFNMFATTVYYYFFNDVVPGAYMARFFGLFRLVSGLGGVIWNIFFYQHALTHMRWIFLGAAVLYGIGFVMMCLMIKEGKYPPPDPIGVGLWAKLKTYAKECLSHRLFRLMFLHNMAWGASGAMGAYMVFLQRDSLGVTLQQIGMIAGVVGVVQMSLALPAGWLADRFHPMRIMVWIKIGLVAIVPLNFIWLVADFTPKQAFYILCGMAAIELPLGVLYDTARQPMQMLVWPKSRYGQFCSFNAITSAICIAAASVLAGLFMTGMRHLLPDETFGKDYCYRMIPAWRLPLLVIALMYLLAMYREWKLLGGRDHYKVPGFVHEEVERADEVEDKSSTKPAGG